MVGQDKLNYCTVGNDTLNIYCSASDMQKYSSRLSVLAEILRTFAELHNSKLRHLILPLCGNFDLKTCWKKDFNVIHVRRSILSIYGLKIDGRISKLR